MNRMSRYYLPAMTYGSWSSRSKAFTWDLISLICPEICCEWVVVRSKILSKSWLVRGSNEVELEPP